MSVQLTFDGALQRYVNKDYAELVSIAKSVKDIFYPACQQADTKYGGEYLLTCIAIAGVTVDKEFSQIEKQFLCEVMNIPANSFDTYRNSYSESLYGDIDAFTDSLDITKKSALLTFLICICACDEHIQRCETAYLTKLLN